ncbi:MAG: peptidoglycan DD-metalloendopeptidase family protein [Acidobacteriota bacterium]
MQNTPVIRAVAVAALLAFGVSGSAEARPKARPASRGKASRAPAASHAKAHHGAKGKKPSVSRRRSGAKPARTAASRRNGKRPAAHAPRQVRGKTRIHQSESGDIVVDRVVLADAFGEIAGPPRELQNFPPAPCEPADAVIEAHLHDVESDAAESDAADVSQAPERDADAEVASAAGSPSGTRASLSRIARRIGSFFRPKSSESAVRPQDVDLTELVSKDFMIPVAGVDAERLRDSFLSSRGRHAKHLAIDIGAPKGTPILATTDGEITRISRERRGGKSIYQKDATGQYLLFYCHLSEYAEDLQVGEKVRKGDVIGYVGSTGHVIGGSHLHFSITRLAEDDSNFRRGLAINPYLLFLAGVP